MSRNLHDAGDRAATLARLRRLTPASEGRWGTMSAPRMVAHLADQVRNALGEIEAAARPGILRFWPVRKAAIYFVPWPKRYKGPPELFVTAPTTWDADVAELARLVERFAARDASGRWPDHPYLGGMSGRDWSVFTWRHFDHHLRQFGSAPGRRTPY